MNLPLRLLPLLLWLGGLSVIVARAAGAGLVLPACFSDNLVLPPVDDSADRSRPLLWGWCGFDEKVEVQLPGYRKPLATDTVREDKKAGLKLWQLRVGDLDRRTPLPTDSPFSLSVRAGRGDRFTSVTLTNVVVGTVHALGTVRGTQPPARAALAGTGHLRVLRVRSLDWEPGPRPAPRFSDRPPPGHPAVMPHEVGRYLPSGWEPVTPALLDDPDYATEALFVVAELAASSGGVAGVILVPRSPGTLRPPFRDSARVPGSSLLHAACDNAARAAEAALEPHWHSYRQELIALKREGLIKPAPPQSARLQPRAYDPAQLPWLRLSGVARAD